ncbi:MAG: hypothetical protein HC930_08535 [Hydrococcus sp. SU_1_0]|nr:hypothetical protein [Hydrococcus sp. SU_1_0]
MVTDRRAIQSYFAKTEENAVQQYANKHRLTLSKAVEALVKKGLSGDSETPEELVCSNLLEERLDRLEKSLDEAVTLMFRTGEKNEKAEYQICCLQEDLERFKQVFKEKSVVEYSDDRVAAMTGQRMQTVWEWRHGLRKPRGHKVLKALEGISVIDGRWQKQG